MDDNELRERLRVRFPQPYVLRKALAAEGYRVNKSTVARWFQAQPVTWRKQARPVLERILAKWGAS